MLSRRSPDAACDPGVERAAFASPARHLSQGSRTSTRGVSGDAHPVHEAGRYHTATGRKRIEAKLSVIGIDAFEQLDVGDRSVHASELVRARFECQRDGSELECVNQSLLARVGWRRMPGGGQPQFDSALTCHAKR